jgi:hypothetical protein
MTDLMAPEQHTARDGRRVITFQGELVASASSANPSSKGRWTELRVYRSKGGSWIVEKVGRSTVVHEPGCERVQTEKLPRFQEAHPGHDPDDGYVFCECVPEVYDFTTLLAEEDRYWASICQDVDALVEAVHRRKNGTRRLPYFAQGVLEALSERYPEVASAYRVEVVE